jgi:hypothetical protein
MRRHGSSRYADGSRTLTLLAIARTLATLRTDADITG